MATKQSEMTGLGEIPIEDDVRPTKMVSVPSPGGEVHQPDHMLAVIERVAMNPDVPIERLEQMMALKERFEANERMERAREAARAFHRDMADAQMAMPIVRRNKVNTHTRSNYADIGAVLEQCGPVIGKFGFSLMFWSAGTAENGDIRVRWRLSHREGHSETDVAEFPPDGAGAQGKTNKTGIQAQASTYTYARRYLTIMLFNIATEDDVDGNRGDLGPVEIHPDRLAELRRVVDQLSEERQHKFLRYAEVERLEDVHPGAFRVVYNLAHQALKAQQKEAQTDDA